MFASESNEHPGWMLILAMGRLVRKVVSKACTSMFVPASGAGGFHLGLAAVAGGQSRRGVVLPPCLVEKCL